MASIRCWHNSLLLRHTDKKLCKNDILVGMYYKIKFLLGKKSTCVGVVEQIISGCPIDGAISVRVYGGFGSYRWFVYITTLLLHP